VQFGRLMFTAYEGFVVATSQSADDLKRWVGVTSLGAGQYQDFAAKPLATPESSEQPSSDPPKTAKNLLIRPHPFACGWGKRAESALRVKSWVTAGGASPA
jgi:hypothetical protein